MKATSPVTVHTGWGALRSVFSVDQESRGSDRVVGQSRFRRQLTKEPHFRESPEEASREDARDLPWVVQQNLCQRGR